MAAKKTVLVVDDNVLNRAILCKILRADGYDTLEAADGLSALRLLVDGSSQIALLLLDIAIPVMNGYELLQKMNETGIIASVPVIVTTGNEKEDAEIRCLDCGASDFLKKPYNAELVRHRVKSLLRLCDNAALLNRLETDRLTGLYSKESFYRHAEDMLCEHPGVKFDLVYLDIDAFKMINAHYGTAAGDELLKFLAGYFSRQVGGRGVCGRIGADIFGVLLPKSSSRTQEATGRLLSEDMKDAPVRGFSFKCGVYHVLDRALPISDMCDRAKLALESIKNQYGVYYAVYDDAMRSKALWEHRLAGCMEEALEKKQFLVYLQPKHDTETGAVAGAEALVRWNHPELGFIAPGEFIPLFERNGFIAKLDYYMWTEVCALLKRWLEEGWQPIPISVNASRADFSTPDLPGKIQSLVDAYGVPHELIHFEVTESAYTDNPKKLVSAVSALRDMGFKIEMDDFGSGYSSLNMLSELPIDILKLDMRFMQGGNERIRDGKRNILSFIISLSKWLQLPTVAEGVETQEEVDTLKAMGCNYIQGYYYARPMPSHEFEAYLLARAPQSEPLEEANPYPAPPAAEGSDEAKPLVLIVEDIESNREIMKELLRKSYRVATAENGAVASKYIQAHRSAISCILLDLLMPVMDGFQLLELLRADGTLGEIPVIITTETGSNSELRALHLGADSFVAKPYNAEILLHHVKKAVEEKGFWKIKRAFEHESCALYEKAYRDELTGLLNRHGLKEAIGRLPDNTKHTEIMLDIDNLKVMNDTYGHTAGDEMIRTVADVLRKSTRSGDIVSRVGGDEFMVILRGMDSAAAAREKAQSICDAIRKADIPGWAIHASCSAGITQMSRAEDTDAVYRRVDRALYLAKHSGKGICRFGEDSCADTQKEN